MEIRIGEVWYRKTTGEKFTVESLFTHNGSEVIVIREVNRGPCSPPEGTQKLMVREMFLILYVQNRPRSIYEKWQPSCEELD